MRLKKRHKRDEENTTPLLFAMPAARPQIKVKVPEHPIWTENKARLIERYLYYFVLVTKHGTYIDGFAGPQNSEVPDSWAAQLVLETKPAWLRHFYLFDEDPAKIQHLQRLKAQQDKRRDVNVFPGDFNKEIRQLLDSGRIKQKEATFCLLDQRTFECRWATLESLAAYKTDGHKIELFYFFANHWLGRAFAAHTKNRNEINEWWGSPDWLSLKGMNAWERVRVFCDRIQQELHYGSVMPWAIYRRQDGGNIMYFMIHATDHPDAPALMSRAYRNAVRPKEPPEQLSLESLLHDE